MGHVLHYDMSYISSGHVLYYDDMSYISRGHVLYIIRTCPIKFGDFKVEHALNYSSNFEVICKFGCDYPGFQLDINFI